MPVDAHGDTAANGPEATAAAPGQPATRRHGQPLRAGDQLGRYHIERELGAGGMGLVYAAHDPDLDRRVAIKVLRGEAGGEARLRLLREARAMAKLSHRNVVTVHEVGTADGVDFVAMELLDGGSLADWLRAERRPAAEVLRRFRAAGAGLVAAHARGLVHRDFKPANVLLGHDGRVVVTDFGLARAYEADVLAATLPAPAPASPTAGAGPAAAALDATQAAPPSSSTASASRSGADLSSTLTATGAMLGTPAYMAPEQHAGHQAGPAADQFAFAVALWEGLTGQRPFAGRTTAELRAAVDRGPPDPSGLPRAVRPVLVRALAPDADARWPDLAALLAALDRAVDGPRRLARGAVIAAGLGALAGGALLYATGRDDGDGRAARADAPACGLSDADVDAAWSPTVAATVPSALTADPRWKPMATRLDQFVLGWRRERAAACADPAAPTHHGRLACLAGLRDEVAGAVTLIRELPPTALAGVDSPDLVPSPEACRSGRRAAAPPLPTDPSTRAALAALGVDATRSRLLARGGPPGHAAARALADEVVAQSRALATTYPAAVAIALSTKATVTQLTGACADAVALFEEAATAAEAAGADGVRALARVGALECTRNTSSDMAVIQRHVDQARAAIQRAGDDPLLSASVALIVAGLDASAGRLDAAITQTQAAHAALTAAGDDRRATVAADTLAAYFALRDGPGDDDARTALLRQGLSWAERAHGAGAQETEARRFYLALALHGGDRAEASALMARAVAAAPPEPVAAAERVEVRGRVLDASGRPAAGVEIVATPAPVILSFDGDPIRGLQEGFVATHAGSDGTFQLQVPARAAVMARADGLASSAVRADARPVTLRLQPTGSARTRLRIQHAGTAGPGDDPVVVMGRRGRIIAAQAMDQGRAVAAIGFQNGDEWEMAGLPMAATRAMVVAVSPLGDFRYFGADLALRPGQGATTTLEVDLGGAVVDVIVRPERGRIPTAQVVLIADDELLSASTTGQINTRIMRHRLTHVGAAIPVTPTTATSVGTARYQGGDLHVRLAGVAPGPTVACVVPFAGDLSDQRYVATLTAPDEIEAKCSRVVIDASPLQAVVVTAPPMKNVVP